MRAFGGKVGFGFTRPVHFGCSLFLVCLGVVQLGGCGPSGPATVPVSGTVKLDGQPLDGALVSFESDADSWTAKTDKDGYYQFPNGTKPLKYRVVISKFEGKGDVVLDPAMGMDEGQLEAMASADPKSKAVDNIAKQLVPEKYSSKTASELSFTVPLTGTQEANFDLTK